MTSLQQRVQTAFQADTRLAARVLDAASKYGEEVAQLLADITQYITTNPSSAPSDTGTGKKRRLVEDAVANGSGSAHAVVPNGSATVAFECKNVSFQVPARKKLKLQLVADSGQSGRAELRLLNPTTDHPEFTVPTANIEAAFCLPVPDKQQRQWNFCLFPTTGAAAAGGQPYEQVVFTLNETAPTDASSATRAAVDGDTYVTVTEAEFNQLLAPYRKKVTRPDEVEFASSIPQSHRKGERAYHVNAHRGSKEGYLFFLSNGIVFGFKKPLAFFPFSSIESISYTAVLQRTFNLVITATEPDGSDAKETEFSMLDQADFAGIDGYIKRHGLNDASMAADRRAKAYNVNKEPQKRNGDDAAPANGAEDDGLTELQRAEQQLQDAEDEEEEDYEASGGESDGEGEYSEDEEGDYQGDEVEGEAAEYEGEEYDEEGGEVEMEG